MKMYLTIQRIVKVPKLTCKLKPRKGPRICTSSLTFTCLMILYQKSINYLYTPKIEFCYTAATCSQKSRGIYNHNRYLSNLGLRDSGLYCYQIYPKMARTAHICYSKQCFSPEKQIQFKCIFFHLRNSRNMPNRLALSFKIFNK